MDVDSTIAYLEYLDYIDLQNYCHHNKNFLCDHILKEILIRKGYRVPDNLPYLLQEFYKLINNIVFYLHPTIPNYANNKKRFYDNRVKILRTEIVDQLIIHMASYLLHDSLNLTLDINIMKTAFPNRYNENHINISVDMMDDYFISNFINFNLIDEYKSNANDIKNLLRLVPISLKDGKSISDKIENLININSLIYEKIIYHIKIILNDLLFIKI